MAFSKKIPDARALGGVQRPRRRWFVRTSLVIEGTLAMQRTESCACCRRSMEPTRGPGYCAACVRHQGLYLLARVLIAASIVGLGRLAPSFVFEAFPFLGVVGHAALVFAVCAVPVLLVALLLNFWPADPVHGDWGKAVCFVGAGSSPKTVFHNPRYGRELLAGGCAKAWEIKRPRAGLANLFLLAALMPAGIAVLAAYQLPHHHVVLYVDNASDRALRIETDDKRLLGTAAASTATALSVPMLSMSLVARAPDGKEVDRISVGNLDDILADAYESLYPDIEFDVGSTFIWNLEQVHCYRASAHMYGTFGMGGGRHLHREKAFVSNTSEPFKNAPSSIESTIGIGSVQELLRVPCPE